MLVCCRSAYWGMIEYCTRVTLYGKWQGLLVIEWCDLRRWHVVFKGVEELLTVNAVWKWSRMRWFYQLVNRRFDKILITGYACSLADWILLYKHASLYSENPKYWMGLKFVLGHNDDNNNNNNNNGEFLYSACILITELRAVHHMISGLAFWRSFRYVIQVFLIILLSGMIW